MFQRCWTWCTSNGLTFSISKCWGAGWERLRWQYLYIPCSALFAVLACYKTSTADVARGTDISYRLNEVSVYLFCVVVQTSWHILRGGWTWRYGNDCTIHAGWYCKSISQWMTCTTRKFLRSRAMSRLVCILSLVTPFASAIHNGAAFPEPEFDRTLNYPISIVLRTRSKHLRRKTLSKFTVLGCYIIAILSNQIPLFLSKSMLRLYHLKFGRGVTS
jgi:hypothetical protein